MVQEDFLIYDYSYVSDVLDSVSVTADWSVLVVVVSFAFFLYLFVNFLFRI
jgi:hypothetical protein